jgi:hypothetical protein
MGPATRATASRPQGVHFSAMAGRPPGSPLPYPVFHGRVFWGPCRAEGPAGRPPGPPLPDASCAPRVWEGRPWWPPVEPVHPSWRALASKTPPRVSPTRLGPQNGEGRGHTIPRIASLAVALQHCRPSVSGGRPSVYELVMPRRIASTPSATATRAVAVNTRTSRPSRSVEL